MYKSTFMGLNTALRGVLAQQTALDVTGHNIANLNTEGYSRQRAEMTVTTPWSTAALNSQVSPGQLGTGVEVTFLERLRDKYVDGNARIQFGQQASSQAEVEQLQQVESAFNEPGDSGLSALMRKFFSAMDTVAAHPEDMGARRAFAQSADAMAEGFRSVMANLSSVAGQSQTRLADTTTEINSLSQRIAALNSEIRDANNAGQQPNDLLDTRDRLMDDLSKLVNYSYTENAAGEVTITFGTATPINLVDPSVPPGFSTLTLPSVELDAAYASGDLTSGRAFADEQLLNTTIPAQMQWMNDLADAIVTGVNNQHTAGFDLAGNPGIAVFEPGSTAANMTLLLVPPAAANILTDPSLVAASGSAGAQPGNADNFLAMLAQRGAGQPLLLGATWEGFYQGSIAGLGTVAQAAQRDLANRDMLVELADNRRSQVSGVSLDEEMSNMLRFQHAYNASARVLTTMDEALDTLINRMGRVGL